MKQAVQFGRFKWYSTGSNNEVEVSLLQFEDDTLFVGEASLSNMLSVKSILHFFELASGLMVNFNKSKLIRIAIDNGDLHPMAGLLNFRIDYIPFNYLGIPIGGNPQRIQFWEPVIKKLQNRLSRWKQKQLSFGGRICLIQSTLSSIPLFFLSIFKFPAGVEKRCTQIIRNFIWGGPDGEPKLA